MQAECHGGALLAIAEGLDGANRVGRRVLRLELEEIEDQPSDDIGGSGAAGSNHRERGALGGPLLAGEGSGAVLVVVGDGFRGQDLVEEGGDLLLRDLLGVANGADCALLDRETRIFRVADAVGGELVAAGGVDALDGLVGVLLVLLEELLGLGLQVGRSIGKAALVNTLDLLRERCNGGSVTLNYSSQSSSEEEGGGGDSSGLHFGGWMIDDWDISKMRELGCFVIEIGCCVDCSGGGCDAVFPGAVKPVFIHGICSVLLLREQIVNRHLEWIPFLERFFVRFNASSVGG